MIEEGRGHWDPESDPEYGQRLLPFLVRRYIWLLIAGLVLGGLAMGIVSLFMPPVYATGGSIQINKGKATAGMLSGLSLFGRPSVALQDEILIITSRDIGYEVIDELGLQVVVSDPKSADAPFERIRQKLFPVKDESSRVEQYSRLTIRNVDVSDDMLSSQEGWITADAEGNWQYRSLSGKAGEPVVTPSYTFTPIFGPAHKAGDRYFLTVKPDNLAWKSYHESLKVQAADKNAATILLVSYYDSNPLIVKQVIELVIEKYLAYNREVTFGDFDVMLDFVTGEMAASETRLAELRDEMKTYQEEHGLYQIDSQGAAAVELIADLNAQKVENRIQLKQIDSVLNIMDSRSPGDVIKTIQAPATKLTIETELVSRLAGLIGSVETARLTKTAEHPDVVSLESRINTTLGQIRESLESSRDSIKLAVGQLDQNIAGQYGQLEKLPEAVSRMGMISAEMKTLQEAMLVLKAEETRTRLQKASTSIEVRLLDGPPLPARRESPKIMRNGFLGAVGGMGLVFLLVLVRESMNKRFRSLRDLRKGARTRVLMTINGRRSRSAWKPSEPDLETMKRLGKYLTSISKRIGIVHIGGDPLQYDLAWGLAKALKAKDSRVLLMDADYLDHGLSTAFNKAEGPGFSDLARGNGYQAKSAVELEDGIVLMRPGEDHIDTETARGCLDELDKQYSAIITCLPHPDVWTREEAVFAALNHVVITLPQGSIGTDELREVASQLRGRGVNIRGVVVTQYAARRDYLASEELRYVTIKPAK